MLCFVLITPAPMSNSLVEITHYMCEGFTVSLFHFVGFLGYDTNVLGEYFYFRGMYCPRLHGRCSRYTKYETSFCI